MNLLSAAGGICCARSVFFSLDPLLLLLLVHAQPWHCYSCYLTPIFVVQSELHVTLWHSNNTGGQAAQREALMTTAGQEVQLRIVAIDCSPEVTAAQVMISARLFGIHVLKSLSTTAHVASACAPVQRRPINSNVQLFPFVCSAVQLTAAWVQLGHLIHLDITQSMQ